MKLIFIRHGDPDYDNDCVTEKGKKEVEYLADMKTYTQKYDILETQESKRDIVTLIETWEAQIGG